MLRIREAKSSPYHFVPVVRSLMAHTADSFMFVTNGVKKDRVKDEELK
jgi:hypothetical protein